MTLPPWSVEILSKYKYPMEFKYFTEMQDNMHCVMLVRILY